MESEEEIPIPFPSPTPARAPASQLLRDLSNFKTPRQNRPPRKPDLQTPGTRFFTATKQTPMAASSSRCSLAPPSCRSKTARRLRALEIEQSQSARREMVQKERSLKSLAKSMTVWLNFLLESPGSCGCDLTIGVQTGDRDGVASTGKRDGFPVIGVRVDAAWRSPKRRRDSGWRGGDVESDSGFPSSAYLSLQTSLKDLCSFEDLKWRIRVYLSLAGCKEVFDVMTQVTKNIDEGRLKMKAHCPIVTDVGLKEKATRILMCYNPVWLRIGLYIVFGGDSLLCDRDDNSDQETAFLRMIIEKQFFSHTGLAKAYAYNKMVEGLYRPGYYEALGNIVLKRLLLLALVLDRAKSQSSLSLKYGIDGIDGGSPLLFTVQSRIKSTRQVIQEILSSDTMRGEGDVIAHLTMVGYKVSYQQNPLVEYDFKVSDLFVDLQDGVRLCRATHLLLDDSSILTKLVVPSDTSKKHLANCGVVLQYLRQAGVSLYDDDGVMIVGDDIVNGDRELTLSLLWKMFVHLQLPHLMKKTMLVEEIYKISGADMNHFNTSTTSTPLELILSWIKAICKNYNCRVDSFSSLVDGKAIWCLLDYYFRKELPCSSPSKGSCRSGGEESIVLATDYPDAVHNFLLSQKLTTLLGNFPEVLQISDILEYGGACNEKSVVILLVFLASQLIVKKNMDQLNFHKLLGCHCQSPLRKYSSTEPCFPSSEEVGTYVHRAEDSARNFKAIQAWWQEMTQKNYQSVAKQAAPTSLHLSTSKNIIDIHRETAAKAIQAQYRRAISYRNYVKMKKAASLLQTVIHAWLIARKKSTSISFSASHVQGCLHESWKQSETWRRYGVYIFDRHSFINLKKSVLLIQRAVRHWMTRRPQQCRPGTRDASVLAVISASVVIQKHCRGWLARSRFFQEVSQLEKAIYRHFAATKIQSHFRCWLLRRRFQNQKVATLKIQNRFRMSGCLKACQRTFQNQKQAILTIQSSFRMSRYLKAYQHHKKLSKSATVIQSLVRQWIGRRETCRRSHLIIVIQRHFRGYLARRHFFTQREAAIKIQNAFRGVKCRAIYESQRYAALDIQRFVRGEISRKKLLGTSRLTVGTRYAPILRSLRGCTSSYEMKLVVCSVIKLQRWWRSVSLKQRAKSAVIIQSHTRSWIARRKANRQSLLAGTPHGSHLRALSSEMKYAYCSVIKIQRWWRRMSLKLKAKSAVIVQSHTRRWIARREANRRRHHIVAIQSYWKGYLARKESRDQLLDLRQRMEKTAANIDDGMRIINRLIAAVSELLSKKSVSGILHTVATLDMATQYSKKCCEELVKARAINTLLELIRSVSRSVPDQEVLKHTLSTLRNLASYPHLVDVLIDCRGSIETILLQLLRNKDEGYFITSQLMKKICSSPKGIEAVRKSPAFLKRLHSLTEELTRKAYNEKRMARGPIARENTDRRLKEAVCILKMVTEG